MSRVRRDRSSLFVPLSAALAAVFGLASTARSSEVPAAKTDVYDLPAIVAVQNREYFMPESLMLNLGYLPSDAFNKGYAIGAAYSYYLSDFLAWEVVNYDYINNQETSIKSQLYNLNVTVKGVGNGGVVDYPTSLLTTGLVYTPFYSKNLLFNKRIVQGELSLFLGAGEAFFAQTGTRILVTPGFQFRFFLNRSNAVRLFFRDHFYSDPNSGLTSMIDMGIGWEFRIDFFNGRRASPPP